MIHWKMDTTLLSFEGDCDWDDVDLDYEGEEGKWPYKYVIVYQGKRYPYSQFQEDGWELPIEEFKSKWGIKDIQTLGRIHCRAGYTDKLNPEKSWYGKNPETMAKLKKYLEELEKEKDNGS